SDPGAIEVAPLPAGPPTGHSPQRCVTVSTEDNGNCLPVQRLWVDPDGVEPDEVAAEGRDVVAPESAHGGDVLLGAGSASSERNSECGELLGRPPTPTPRTNR